MIQVALGVSGTKAMDKNVAFLFILLHIKSRLVPSNREGDVRCDSSIKCCGAHTLPQKESGA